MTKAGFIGYGHMGSVLLRGMLNTRALSPSDTLLATRTPDRAREIVDLYPQVTICSDNRAVAAGSQVLFLCVGTLQVKPVLDEIGGEMNADAHLISVAGGLEIRCLERSFSGAISKVIPTIIAEAQEGVSLVCHNAKVTPAQRNLLKKLLEPIGAVKEIAESQFEIGADFTSCAPGLLASICDQFVEAGIRDGGFTYEEASHMVLRTMFGTAKLLLQNGEDFRSLIGRVATKGGSTEAGVGVLERELPGVFDRMLAATMERHEARKQATRRQFELPM